MKSLLKYIAIIVTIYIVVSLFYDTTSSDKIRSEYASIQGTFETFDLSNPDLAVLEDQGSRSLNTLGSIAVELWDIIYSSLQGSFSNISNTFTSDDTIENTISTPNGWPINRDNLSSSIGQYGMRFHPIYKKFITHKGVDLPCAKGKPVYATADGVVETSSFGQLNKGYGQMVLIKHNNEYKSRYAHLSVRTVLGGQSVKKGQIIGLVGSSGGSTGSHLHYEVIRDGRAVDPMPYMN